MYFYVDFAIMKNSFLSSASAAWKGSTDDSIHCNSCLSWIYFCCTGLKKSLKKQFVKSRKVTGFPTNKQ